jgi:TPR repeat protein
MYRQDNYRKYFSQGCALLALCFAQTATADTEGISGAINRFFQGGQIESAMKQNQQQNADIANSVTPEVVSETQNSLPKFPKFNDFIGKIKYGTHNTVSENGEQVVTLIRSLATNPERKESTLQQLVTLARARNPEAMNFAGFALANGLFGTTKNQARAVEYFKAAAEANYQPAIYNLAINAAYGGQGKESLAQAATYITRASNIAPDGSARVCGFASFIYYRLRELRDAGHYTQGCSSALAGLPLAVSNSTLPSAKRIALLRTSISTGVNDAYPLLERVAQENAVNDNEYLYCKYYIFNRVRAQPQLAAKDLAAQCYDKYTHVDASAKIDTNRRNQAILGITSFVYSERLALEQLRASNHFHYAWSVPYLPFQQQDVDLFEPLFPKDTQ